MKLVSRRTILGATGAAAICLLAARLAGGQAGLAQKPQLAEEVFKNVQVLKGIPVDEFMSTMGVFSAALGMSCEDCHASNDSKWENYALDTSPRKQVARRMVRMVTASGACEMSILMPSRASGVAPYLVPLMSTVSWSHPAISTEPLKLSSEMRPPCGIASTALKMRLVRTSRSADSCPATNGDAFASATTSTVNPVAWVWRRHFGSVSETAC